MTEILQAAERASAVMAKLSAKAAVISAQMRSMTAAMGTDREKLEIAALNRLLSELEVYL